MIGHMVGGWSSGNARCLRGCAKLEKCAGQRLAKSWSGSTARLRGLWCISPSGPFEWELVTVANMLDQQTGMKGSAYFLKRRRLSQRVVQATAIVPAKGGVTPKIAVENAKSVRLYVTGLSFEEDDLSLAGIFRDFPVVSARVARFRNGKSRGFGFVELEGRANVEKALAKNGTEARGRKLLVQLFKEEPSLPPTVLVSH